MKKTIMLSLVTLCFAAFTFAQPASETVPPSPPPAGTSSANATPPETPPSDATTANTTTTTTTAETTETKVTATPPETTFDGTASVGYQNVHEDTGSAKFREYRDVPDGPVVPFLRLRTTSGDFGFNLTAENPTRVDKRFMFGVNTSSLRVLGDYNVIPHRFGVGHSLETQTSAGAMEISDTLQAAHQSAIEQAWTANHSSINYAFLSALVAPSLKTANAINLELIRKRGFVDFNVLPDAKVNTHVTYFAESRSGNRAAGTSFGFSNVVETPEPINYRTVDVGATAEMPLKEGLLRGGLRVNTFKDSLSSYTFDNPWRATDSTDPSAYSSPGSGSIGGPKVGRIGAPPDNQAINGSVGFLYKLPMHSRISADLNIGRWKQDDVFIPYTTNTAIVSPLNASDIGTLPAHSLDGQINTTGAVFQFTSTPIANLNIDARYRYYDFDNQTDRITFPGYVRFDAAWQSIGRISVPYSYKTGRGDVTATYDFGKTDIEAGFRSETRHHTYREVESDTENVIRLGTDVRAIPWTVFRASFEFGNRDINGYNPDEAEDASFTTPPAPTQPPTLRRFDVNARKVTRIVSSLQLTPRDGNLSFDLSYLHNLDDYDDEM
jgi:hypothetical protein